MLLKNKLVLFLFRHRARYDYTHEVLPADVSQFKGQCIPRDRRISIICRNEPEKNDWCSSPFFSFFIFFFQIQCIMEMTRLWITSNNRSKSKISFSGNWAFCYCCYCCFIWCRSFVREFPFWGLLRCSCIVLFNYNDWSSNETKNWLCLQLIAKLIDDWIDW